VGGIPVEEIEDFEQIVGVREIGIPRLPAELMLEEEFQASIHIFRFWHAATAFPYSSYRQSL